MTVIPLRFLRGLPQGIYRSVPVFKNGPSRQPWAGASKKGLLFFYLRQRPQGDPEGKCPQNKSVGPYGVLK